jgi:hypothetical protein
MHSAPPRAASTGDDAGGGTVSETWVKNAIAMNISRDMAILHGLVKPTPEEGEQYDGPLTTTPPSVTAARPTARIASPGRVTPSGLSLAPWGSSRPMAGVTADPDPSR